MLIIVVLLLVLYFSGILPKFMTMIGGLNYHVDTTQAENCHNLYTQELGDIPYKDLMTDLDNDELFDAACDTCNCRDGYDGEFCKTLVSGVPATAEYNVLRTVLGLEINNNAEVLESTELPECRKRGKETPVHYCSTDNIGEFDTDNDMLPDICDKYPEEFDTRARCYEGRIFAKDDKTVIGYMHKEPYIGLDGYFCVLSICTDKVLIVDDYSYFKKYCSEGFFKLENNNLAWVTDSNSFNQILTNYKG